MTLQEGIKLEKGDIIESCVEGTILLGEIIGKHIEDNVLIIDVQWEDDMEGELIFGDKYNQFTADCLKNMRVVQC